MEPPQEKKKKDKKKTQASRCDEWTKEVLIIQGI